MHIHSHTGGGSTAKNQAISLKKMQYFLLILRGQTITLFNLGEYFKIQNT